MLAEKVERTSRNLEKVPIEELAITETSILKQKQVFKGEKRQSISWDESLGSNTELRS